MLVCILLVLHLLINHSPLLLVLIVIMLLLPLLLLLFLLSSSTEIGLAFMPVRRDGRQDESPHIRRRYWFPLCDLQQDISCATRYYSAGCGLIVRSGFHLPAYARRLNRLRKFTARGLWTYVPCDRAIQLRTSATTAQ
jgi:hypothetical protein